MICSICKGHIDKCCEENMEGSGLGADIKEVSGKVKKGTKRVSKKVGKYVTTPEGLASDVVNYGIPSATAALLGTPAGIVGGPVAGMAASALGSKLGSMAADKISSETEITNREGEGLAKKRKSRFPKGSQEAKDHMKMLREKKGKK